MEGLSQNEKIIWNCWEEKSPRDMVREAAAKGTHINLAIKYLMSKNSWSESTAQDWFMAEVKAWTVQLLMRKQIYKVLHILNKCNINPEEHLMVLAETSPEIEYRDFIVENLQKLSKDMKSENVKRWEDFKRHWNLLRYLEKSFEVDGTFKQNKVFGIGSNRVFVNESEIKALTIENIEKYPPDWKCKIATALFFDTFEFSLLDFSTPLNMWNYLVDHNKSMILVRWINVQMSEVVRDMNARYNFFNNDNFVQKLLHVDTKGFTNEVLDALDEIFRKWPISTEMIEIISNTTCFEYTKMCIYDTLASYGIIVESEKKDLYQIIARLARTQNLKLIDDIFSESCATMSMQEFYLELAKYFVKNKLYKVLTICIEGHILDIDLSEVEQEAKDCIELWLLFKSIEQTSDRQSHVVPVYKTCQQIAKDDIENYISANPHLVLGMILLEDNLNLFDIFSKEQFLQFKDFKLPNKGYKHKHPHLYNVYKKHASKNEMYECKDVNVYQLLSGYRGLDVSKIFEFQIINMNSNNQLPDKTDRRSLGSLISNEVDVHGLKALTQRTVDMPDFANEKLMKRYGYDAKLNHTYYLKQYRPCNASQAFVSQQYQIYNRLQEKSIKSACCEAHALALQNWSDTALTACAISFVAMIGCNPTRCRVHVSATKMIRNHLVQRKGFPENEANKIINEFMIKLIQNNDETAATILKYLEEITSCKLKEIQEAGGKHDMSLVLYESQTMVKFAMLHNLQLPEMQLREFVRNGSWFNFLLFGDVFRYPLPQMLQLSQDFEKTSYAEHLKYIMVHKSAEDDKEQKSNSSNGQRRLTRLNSVETSPTQSVVFDFPPSTYMGRELWEVAAACHGPEDPPAALLRAADLYREPLLVLLASCYEPNAVDVLWAHWILSSLEPNERSREALQTVIAQNVPAQLFQKVAEICLVEGYITTLHESMLIFMPESPLAILTSFLYRCIRRLTFDSETNKYLTSFLQICQRRYSVDASGLPCDLSKDSLQRIAVALVKIALMHNFDMPYHQKEFLKCLAEARFGKDLLVQSPDFTMLYEIFKITMETSSVMNISKMLEDDAPAYFLECVEMYTREGNYDVALQIAKLAALPVDEILIAEWDKKCTRLTGIIVDDLIVYDEDLTYIIAQCSEAFKEAGVSFNRAIEFLSRVYVEDFEQKFYAYRVIMSWFEENRVYGEKREEIEHEMWDAYLRCRVNIAFKDYQGTVNFVLNGQKDSNSQKVDLVHEEKPFSLTLHEIEVESDVVNIENVELLEYPEDIDRWKKAVSELLELKLLVEGFRLAALYKPPDEYRYGSPVCPVQIIRTCLRLAEGTCSPYELPQELRLVISSPTLQNKLTVSEASETSFEELVVIQERQDGDGVPHLAAREEADRLSALEALAVRSGLSVAKQIASYFRIALQIGWDYASVLKYQSRPLDFINLVSGRARMSLANLVFRTFNIPSKQIAEYLCREMVAAIISPHLLKTSTFRQKEHFQYTLWGYILDSDIEMFLNMRPDACSQIGRLILDHLMAFQKIYKATGVLKIPENSLDDSCLDVETLIDEEYQNVEGDEVESIMTEEGTLMSAETESVYSVSTVYNAGNKMSRDSRRNLFDVISRSNIHIRYEVKSNIRKITKGAKLSTKQVNIISIELLVLAHECFSCACDTEGVAVVLRSAQALSARLLAARSWRLMVRLLTGLARYTECAYILQALRENHQFEFLLGQFDYMLGQQQDKIAEFKHGLLDFLKTHCPGDTDTYIMVALHFNMYSEAAHVKKKQANDLIDDLEKMASDASKTSRRQSQPVWLMIHDNVPTRSLLDTALNHCNDACELYLQGGCTGFAGEMANLAQKIALQISLLNASPTRLILNRSTEQTYSLVTEYLSFMEGLVLLSSSGSSVWRELAYRRALTNDQAYLRDMATYRPDIAHDFINRYKSEKKRTPVSQAAMTELRTLIR
ncbi:spatacsin [Maniola jurtina]|uniref:spatacsin n=1 Tax=Maniola jurtina TaxID=191418 RepID=UPI001E686415|nr:spatacsin [Maniola jurtina]XP_045785777.1 spatacsin [Maniola jurtina]XP_045785778.1 spatacsin [Maniola jurtina]XP_045785779.1 spatacsin [Maniola jurtina]XP_045785780.1 spatacsin [Maniola jurtina]